jgi:hypothetical protein
MIDIIKKFYPKTEATSAEMIGDILMVKAPGGIRLYKFEGEKLYAYKPTLVSSKDNFGKIKSIIREGKINQVINNG